MMNCMPMPPDQFMGYGQMVPHQPQQLYSYHAYNYGYYQPAQNNSPMLTGQQQAFQQQAAQQMQQACQQQAAQQMKQAFLQEAAQQEQQAFLQQAAQQMQQAFLQQAAQQMQKAFPLQFPELMQQIALTSGHQQMQQFSHDNSSISRGGIAENPGMAAQTCQREQNLLDAVSSSIRGCGTKETISLNLNISKNWLKMSYNKSSENGSNVSSTTEKE